ncbi:hypothetical protein BaRGS_00002617, partial [Batillaria attramentaria]
KSRESVQKYYSILETFKPEKEARVAPLTRRKASTSTFCRARNRKNLGCEIIGHAHEYVHWAFEDGVLGWTVPEIGPDLQRLPELSSKIFAGGLGDCCQQKIGYKGV